MGRGSTPGLTGSAGRLGTRTPGTPVVGTSQGAFQRLSPQLRSSPQGLTSWVRQNNARLTNRTGANASLRQQIPSDRVLDVGRMTRSNPNAANLRNQLGDPKNQFAFNPRLGREPRDFGKGGDHDGDHHHDGAGHHDHHDFDDNDNGFFFGLSLGLWLGNFWYPYYADAPCGWGLYCDGYYPAPYTYWGWTPDWIQQTGAYYDASAPVYLTTGPSAYGAVTTADAAGAQQAIEDIRQAWLTGNAQLLAQHLSDQVGIRIAFDGQYRYTTKAQDFYAMSADAMGTSKVEAMDFDQPVWLSNSDVLFTGKQVFRDPSGEQRTVYLSYRLANAGGNWYIIGAGSSLQPMTSDAGLTQEASAQ